MIETIARHRGDEDAEILRKGYDKPLTQVKPQPAREPREQPAPQQEEQRGSDNG